jgi:formylmethanofuran dehydrogenase subunit E
MCNRDRNGICSVCKDRKEVFKMEEIDINSPEQPQALKEYMLCDKCFKLKMLRHIANGAIQNRDTG